MSPRGFEPRSTGPKPVILSIELWAPRITTYLGFLCFMNWLILNTLFYLIIHG